MELIDIIEENLPLDFPVESVVDYLQLSEREHTLVIRGLSPVIHPHYIPLKTSILSDAMDYDLFYRGDAVLKYRVNYTESRALLERFTGQLFPTDKGGQMTVIMGYRRRNRS